MSETVQRKLTGAKRYISVLTGEDAVLKGAILDVTEEHAEYLDSLEFTDALGNVHPLFSEVSSATETKSPRGKRAKASTGSDE